MVGWLKFNIIEKIPFMVYLEIQCITFKKEKSFIAHPWIQRSVVGLEGYSAHDWRAATSGTARSSYLARVGPVPQTLLWASQRGLFRISWCPVPGLYSSGQFAGMRMSSLNIRHLRSHKKLHHSWYMWEMLIAYQAPGYPVYHNCII